MRFLLLAPVIFLLPLKVSAQEFTYPKLAVQANKIEELTPKNWKVIDTAIGDLNNDKFVDVALIYEYMKPVNERRAYGDNDSEFISEYQRPRILGIYFKNHKTKKYQLSTQNNNFILREGEGGKLGEPLKGIEITDNSLKLSFEGGNDWRWKLDYQFKYQKNEWTLVKAGNTYYNYTFGDMTDRIYDFENRRQQLTVGNIFKRSAANKITSEVLYFSDLRTFKSFKKPWTWQVTDNSFL